MQLTRTTKNGLNHRQYYLGDGQFGEWELGVAQHIDSRCR